MKCTFCGCEHSDDGRVCDDCKRLLSRGSASTVAQVGRRPSILELANVPDLPRAPRSGRPT